MRETEVDSDTGRAARATATIIPFPANVSANAIPTGQPEGPLYVREDGTIPCAQEQAVYLMVRAMLREMLAQPKS